MYKKTLTQRFVKRIGVDPALLIAILVLGVIIISPILARFVPHVDDLVYGINYKEALQAPSTVHLLGTDEYGRDILLRVIYGSQLSFTVALSTVVLVSTAGVVLGLLAGYFVFLDTLLMRLADVCMTIPSMLLALAFVAVFGPSVLGIILALSVVYTARTMRVVRGEVLRVKSEIYVEAAHAIGASTSRVLFAHVLPNCTSPIIVQSTFVLAQAILAEAGLSFLGAGPPPPTPSWGNVLSAGKDLLAIAPWIALAPGLAISIVALCINSIGDTLRDIIDPRSLS